MEEKEQLNHTILTKFPQKFRLFGNLSSQLRSQQTFLATESIFKCPIREVRGVRVGSAHKKMESLVSLGNFLNRKVDDWTGQRSRTSRYSTFR